MSSEHDVVRPEAGSEHGVHLREGRFADLPGLPVPPGYDGGPLYCVYPRCYSRGGTLREVLDDLDRIRDLGACAIWFLPLHPVGEVARKGSRGCPYAIRDDRSLDPALGSTADLRDLVEAAHERDLRVLIDFVANHAAHDHPLVEELPHAVLRDEEGRPWRRVEDWSDITDWRLEVPEVAEHLLETPLHWIEKTGLDGFRCDVAGMVPRSFWTGLRSRFRARGLDPFMLAEWQDPDLHETAFHAGYDWLLHRALRARAQGKGSTAAVGDALLAWPANFPRQAVPLRFLENHDEPRVLSYLQPERLPAYAAVVFLSGGLPLLYAGQEIGARHRPSLFEAEPIAWDEPVAGVETVYRELTALRAPRSFWRSGVLAVEPISHPDLLAFTVSDATGRGAVIANLGTDTVVADPPEGMRQVWGDDPGAGLPGGSVWVGEDA